MPTLEEKITEILEAAADAGAPDMTRPELQEVTIQLARGLRPMFLRAELPKGRPPAESHWTRPLNQPTGRELETLTLIAHGMSAEVAATALDIKPDTVRSHLVRLARRWGIPGGVWAAAALVQRGFADGWLTLPEERLVPKADLAPRELEVLGLLALGLSADGISQRLGASQNTVASLVQRIFGKLDARTRAHAVAQAWRAGLLPLAANVMAA